MTNAYNIVNAIKAQELFCNEQHLPRFAPCDGVCFRCGQNIYKPISHKQQCGDYITGINVDYAKGHLVTGCPHCNHSFCD